MRISSLWRPAIVSLLLLFPASAVIPVAAQSLALDPSARAARPSAVPRLVKYVGQVSRPVHVQVTEGGTGTLSTAQPLRATASTTFAVYAEQDGGAALWQETQNVTLDADGKYSVLLGAASRDGMPTELFSGGEPRWLGVRVNVTGDADASGEQARILLVSVPYALHAADAETLGGRAATDFVLREELAGWSGVASGVMPGPADRPRVVGGTQGVVFATGAVSFLPRVTAINSPAPGDVTYADSQIFDDGTNIRIGNPAVGTGLVNIELTTPLARNAFTSTLRLENTSAITGTVISAMSLTGADRATANHESFQVARFTLLKNVISTGLSTNFDAIFATTSFINQNAPYPIVGWRAEYPRVAVGMTLETYYGLFLEGPLGGGTVTNSFAMVTAPGSGNVGIGTLTPGSLLDVAGDARVTGALRAGQYLDLAGNPVGGGTVLSVASGDGLTGGPITASGTLAVDTTVARRNAANAFTADQSIAGSLSLTGTGNITLTGAINDGLRVQGTTGTPNVIGGYSGNTAGSSAIGATVGGGGGVANPNRVTADYGTVSGGQNNLAGSAGGNPIIGAYAFVGGGQGNMATGNAATIGGGFSNAVDGFAATVGGGQSNVAMGPAGTVAGGVSNAASGVWATVPGGYSNTASGQNSFAAGRRAQANHDGAFVWGDSTDADVTSGATNEFVVRAAGGVRFRNASNNILTIDGNGNVVAGGAISGAGTVSSFTATPTGSAVGQGSVFVNPATAGADNTLFGVAVGGVERFRVDAEGDVTLAGLRTETTVGTPNILGGFTGNSVTGGVVGGTIAGGGVSGFANRVTDDFGFVGGGSNNQAGDNSGTTADRNRATVGGGTNNVASGLISAIGGGAANVASGMLATVGGGSFNTASGDGTTVGGGSNNVASGNPGATVPGGFNNTASGQYSFAAGLRAKALQDGTFVWADSTGADFSSTALNQFLIRAGGGVGINTASPLATTALDVNLGHMLVRGVNGFVAAGNTARLHLGDLNHYIGAVVGSGVRIGTFGAPDAIALKQITGDVGIGVTNPVARLHVVSANNAGEGILVVNTNSTNGNAGIKVILANGSGADYFKCEENGTQVCHVSNAGTFTSGSDFAEALPAIGDRAAYAPGDVLVMSTDGRGVEPTREPYSPRVAGVYSTRPAVLGAEKGGGETRVDAQDVPVAIIGIVPTKVSTENGPIAVGDLLVTSPTPGYAMKGTDRARMLGAVVGKALEPLREGGAVIRVLVNLQ